MFKTWLKKHLPDRHSLHSSLKINGLKHPALWRINCSSFSKGVAIGLFVAMLPIPMQMIIAALFAVLLRAYLPVAVALTWLSNPFTFLPLTYFTYYIGTLLIGENGMPGNIEEFHINFNNLSRTWSSFVSWLSQFSKAYFVGLPFVAIGFALGGYLLVIVLWKGAEWLDKRKKH